MASVLKELETSPEWADWGLKDRMMAGDREKIAQKAKQSSVMEQLRAARALKEGQSCTSSPTIASHRDIAAKASLSPVVAQETPIRVKETTVPIQGSPDQKGVATGVKRKASSPPTDKTDGERTAKKRKTSFVGGSKCHTKPKASSPATNFDADDSAYGSSDASSGEESSSSVSPAKRPMPTVLVNGENACYQNATLHFLSTVPAFANLPPQSVFPTASTLSARDLKDLVAKKKSLLLAAEAKFQRFIDFAQAEGRLPLSAFFAEVMKNMTSRDGVAQYNPKLFHRMCGVLLRRTYDGKSQQDTVDFMGELIFQLGCEWPELKEMLNAQFVQPMKCVRCGTKKKVHTPYMELEVPADKRSIGNRVKLTNMIRQFLQDPQQDFKHYSCEKEGCPAQGEWAHLEDGGTVARRGRVLPDYMTASINRNVQTGHGAVKVLADIELPERIPLKNERAEVVFFKLVAAIGHSGKGTNNGHYTAIRKIGDSWFHCDDAEFDGIRVLDVPDFRRRLTPRRSSSRRRLPPASELASSTARSILV
jgi:hypothetical protein